MLRSFVKCAIDQMRTTMPPYPTTLSKYLAILWNQLPSIGSTEWHFSVVVLSLAVVKLWGNAGEPRSPSVFWQGNAVLLAYTTAVGGRGGMWSTPASTPSSAKF